MPKAHVTVQPTGQAIATTGGHSLARRSGPRKKSPHCKSPTATPVARPVMSRAPIPVPAPVSNAPMASPIATPKAVANTHSGPTLRYLRSTNHWAAPITAPAKAPPSAPDTNPSTEPTTMNAKNPPSGKPTKASIHHRKKRHPTVLESSLSVTVCIVPRSSFGFASHADDDLTSSVSLFQIPDGLGDLAQRVGPVDDGCDLAGFNELFEHDHVLVVLLVDECA